LISIYPQVAPLIEASGIESIIWLILNPVAQYRLVGNILIELLIPCSLKTFPTWA